MAETIKSARVVELPRGNWGSNGDSAVYITMHGQEKEEEEPLFYFYSDEIGFSASEFAGKTKEQGVELKLDKDKKWLQSPSNQVVR